MTNEKRSQTDFKTLRSMMDADIDCSDLEEFTEDFLNSVEGYMETPEKELISIRVDRKVLEFYRKGGKGYQTRMNAVLRGYAEAQEKSRLKRT
jgi:uncharacterized protein (DUF4415 family)